MHSREVLRIAITILIISAMLASLAGTTYAIDGTRGKYLPGTQQFGPGGAGTGTHGAGGMITFPRGQQFAGGSGSGTGVNPSGTGQQQLAPDQGAGGGIGGSPGITGTGPGNSLPAGETLNAAPISKDNLAYAARCKGIAGPGNDPMCNAGGPAIPVSSPPQSVPPIQPGTGPAIPVSSPPQSVPPIQP